MKKLKNIAFEKNIAFSKIHMKLPKSSESHSLFSEAHMK